MGQTPFVAGAFEEGNGVFNPEGHRIVG
jgi:hypothetical protein